MHGSWQYHYNVIGIKGRGYHMTFICNWASYSEPFVYANAESVYDGTVVKKLINIFNVKAAPYVVATTRCAKCSVRVSFLHFT